MKNVKKLMFTIVFIVLFTMTLLPVQAAGPLTASTSCRTINGVKIAFVNWHFTSESPAYINVWINGEVIAYRVKTPADGALNMGISNIGPTVVSVTPADLEQELAGYEVKLNARTCVKKKTFMPFVH